MACSCNQKNVTPKGSPQARDAADRAAKVAAARAANPATTRIGAPKTNSGQSQTFTLEGPGGRVQSFGSQLERDAAAARQNRVLG